MKKYWVLPLMLLALALGHFGPHFSLRVWRSLTQFQEIEQKFAVSGEKPFVIIIPSYNNAKWCERNLSSALDQEYGNYRIIYIDDASTDGMGEKVRNIVAGSDKVEFVHNEANQGAMSNLYYAIQKCSDQEIVVVLDGDDWLANNHVLARLNEVYANPDVWVTYGSYLYYPDYRKGECSKPIPSQVIEKNSFRKEEWRASHLRTFYASLFKQIKLQDFLYEGKFYDSTSDMAVMFPLLEMAGTHARFIKDILCLNNRENPLNDDKVHFVRQQMLKDYIRGLSRYQRLASLPRAPETGQKADLVVFSFDRPMQLYAFLESTGKYVRNTGMISVIYRSSGEKFDRGYDIVKMKFPHVQYLQQGKHPREDFKPLTMKATFDSPAPYVIFAVDDIIVKDSVDLGECIAAMEKSKAHGFFLRLGKQVDYCYMLSKEQGVPPTIPLGGEVYAWQFQVGEGDWKYPHSVDMTVYKKSDIRSTLEEIDFHNPNLLESKWAIKAGAKVMKKAGLCFAESKIVNIPVNLVNLSETANRNMESYSVDDLLEKFRTGLKIDISTLHQIQNRSCHIDYEISFTERQE